MSTPQRRIEPRSPVKTSCAPSDADPSRPAAFCSSKGGLPAPRRAPCRKGTSTPEVAHIMRTGFLILAGALVLSGCELIVDFDRSKIDDDTRDMETPAPDAGPEPDDDDDAGSEADDDGGL